MPVIIDGHNLLWAVQGIEDDPSITDIGLCRVLDRYFGLAGLNGEIIFDGTGPLNKTEFAGIKNLQVSFSGRSSDCDTIIEQRILDSTAPKLLTIVSTDRRLRDAAEDRKAVSTRVEDFWDDVKKQVTRPRPDKEPVGKRYGLTQGETELWMKIFHLEQ
jgi:hypothetical protein